MPTYPLKKLVKRVDDDGKVIIAPPNVINDPIRHGHYNSTIGHTINAFPEYKETGYDQERHKEYENNKKWHEKYKDIGYFKSMSAGPYALNEDKNVFAPKPLGPPKKVWKYKSTFQPQDPFVPSNPNKSGKIEGTFDQFKRLRILKWGQYTIWF